MAIFGGWRLTRTGIFFAIGIIVLGGLVTGGIFLIKNHGEAVRRDQAVKVAEQNLKDQSQVTQTVPADTSTTDQASTGAHADDTTTASTAGSSKAAQLPQTGPDDILALQRTGIVAIIALSVAFYVASRRAARDL